MSELTTKPSNNRPQRLQEYQAMLARRLHAAQTQAAQAGFLGVQIGDAHYLVNLQQAGEILPMQTPTPVPLTHTWYLGVVSARGQLLGVVDFALFMGKTATLVDGSSRLMVLSKRDDHACALLVTRLFGLRPNDELQKIDTAPQADTPVSAAWLKESYQTPDGVVWRVLDVEELLADTHFLHIGR